MNVDFAPTITTDDPQVYKEQIERIFSVCNRVHLDITDGDFAPSKTLTVEESWVPAGAVTDIHIMVHHPERHLAAMLDKKPNLIVIHSEAEGDTIGTLKAIKEAGVKAGLAILFDTQPEEYEAEIKAADHLLVFSGKLGFQGGVADLSILEKVGRAKKINPDLEFGWDGGANADNAAELARAGINVINVGGYISKADDPNHAYAILEQKVNEL